MGDLHDVLLRQLTEHDGLVNTVQELRLEGALQLSHHSLADAGEAGGLVLLGVLLAAVKAQTGILGGGDVLGTHVGGHDDNGVPEVHTAALGVGNDAVLQNLQQDVPHILVGLLDLIEQHHGVGFTAYLLGQLAALLVSHIAGRRAYQTGHGVTLHVLGHVDADHGVLITEHGLGQRLAQLGFAHAGGAKEQEGANGPLGILQSHTAAADGAGHGGNCLILPHNTLLQGLLQLQKARALVLRQAGDGDAGPAGHYVGNVLGGDGAAVLTQLSAPVVPLDLHLIGVVLLNITQLGGLLIVLSGNGLGLFPAQGGDLFLQRLQVGGGALRLHAHLRSGLIHQVDGLVRQEPVTDIPAGEGHGGLQRLIGDGQLVMGLVLVPQTLQNGDGVLRGGLTHGDGLEAALQRGVFFNVLAVLVEGGRADDPDLAPAQGRLEDVGGVHGALGGAGAHDGVQLVDEEDDVAVLLHLVQRVFDTLLELAAVLGAGHHTAQVKAQKLFVQQLLRHIGGGNALGKAFGDGGLADAGFADQYGVVFGAAGEDLHHTLDLLVTADDRVKLALPGRLGQISGKLLQRLAGLFVLLVGGSGAAGDSMGTGLAELLLYGGVHLPGIHAHGAQDAHGHIAAFPQQSHQQMLGADVTGAHPVGFAHGQLDHAFGTGRQALTGGVAGGALSHAALEDTGDHLVGETVFGQHPVGDALLLPQQAQQQMLAAYIAMAQILGSLLRQTQGFFRTGGEFILIHQWSHPFDFMALLGELFQLIPQACRFLVVFTVDGGLQLVFQRVALPLLLEPCLFVPTYQPGGDGGFFFDARGSPCRLLQRSGELSHAVGQHTEVLQQREGVEEAAARGTEGLVQPVGVPQFLGARRAQVNLRHLAVDVALIIEGGFIPATAFTFHQS